MLKLVSLYTANAPGNEQPVQPASPVRLEDHTSRGAGGIAHSED
jgi:hypothetical protein